MCLYPRLVQNPKYKANKKNGGVIPAISDHRVSKVPIGCGKCMECKKQKANGWRVRLLEDIREHTNGVFVTLTFSNESYTKLMGEVYGKEKLKDYDLDNAIATRAVRLFLEKWRKKYGKSVRHWLVTELGHEGTENIHIHGIIWTDDKEAIKERWGMGFVYLGKWVNEQTINYIIKYVTKVDKEHKFYNSIILTSAGIGGYYMKRGDKMIAEFKGVKTMDVYRTRGGQRVGMPIYYRNKLYSEEERESLWIHKLDKNKRYVLGVEIDISKGEEEYERALKNAQRINKELGYGGLAETWEEEQYERQRRVLKQQERIQKR